MQFFCFCLFLPSQKWMHNIYYKLLHHNINSSLIVQNDRHIQMNVIYIFWKYPNIPYRSIKTLSSITLRILIASIICLSIFIIGVMVITDNTHSKFSNSIMFVSFPLQGGHYIYNSFLSIPPCYWRNIRYCIMKTWSEMGLFFSIKIR